MLNYSEITFANIPVLVATAFALWVLTNACFSNPITAMIRNWIASFDKRAVERVKMAQIELSQNVTIEAIERSRDGTCPAKMTEAQRRERQEIVNNYRAPFVKRFLLYPFSMPIMSGVLGSFFAYLATGSDRSSWIMSPLMYAGLVLLVSRVMPEGGTPVQTSHPGRVARSSCGG